MAESCGGCNYLGKIDFPKRYLCLLTQSWTNGNPCRYYQKYTSMSEDIRTTLAIEKKRQIDEEERRIEEDKKEQAREVKQSQESKKKERFKLKTIILNHILGILEGLILAYVIWLWKFKQ